MPVRLSKVYDVKFRKIVVSAFAARPTPEGNARPARGPVDRPDHRRPHRAGDDLDGGEASALTAGRTGDGRFEF